MRRFRVISGLLLAIITCTFFSSYTAHAATSPVASQPHWKLIVTSVKSSSISSIKMPNVKLSSSLKPQANSECVKVSESDTGWGTTYNRYGEQLNLNGIYFGASNTCNVDAVSGSWKIIASGSCPTGTVGGGATIVTSGSLGFLPANDFEKLFAGTLVYQCIYYNSNGTIDEIVAPIHAGASFIIYANLSGGTNSAYVDARDI